MRLKELRKKLKLSQQEFGNQFGISQRLIANYENGVNKPDYTLLIKFADFFGVSVDYLISHQTIGQIDTSQFSEEKKELLNLIVEQDDKTCNRLHAVVFGYLTSYHETKQTFNPFKNFKE